MYQHETQIRVRYAETDQMGYVYYGNYPAYYEVGRVEMMRSLGLTYRDMESKHHVMMPVMSMQCRYIRPALYDDLITVRTQLRQMPERDIIFNVDLLKGEQLIHVGNVRLCFVDTQSMERVSIPAFLSETLKPYF